MSDDEDRTPMTRTELAMLWDLLGTYLELHPTANLAPAGTVRRLIDTELTRRFGG